jgi:hypothetical protein
MNFQALVAANLVGMLAWAAAPGGVIGVAKANGGFRVDDALVSGNATLFDGAAVGTADVPSRIQLRNGTRVELDAESRARFFGGRLALDRGFGELQTSSGYRMEARGLRVATAGAGSVARVRLDGEKAVLVAAVKGPVRVFNDQGLLVANVKAGTTLRFEPQSGAPDSFQVSGCLLRKTGKFILVDQTANQTVEVRGDAAQLGAQRGNRVQITGVVDRTGQPVAGATLAIQMKAMEQVGLGGCLAAAAAAGADPVSRSPAAAVEKTKGHGAVIAGVVVIGAGGAIAGVVLVTRNKSKSP